MKYTVYILYSQSKDRYYTGYTQNLSERLLEHNAGATPSTRPGIPWVIVYKEECENKSATINLEPDTKADADRLYYVLSQGGTDWVAPHDEFRGYWGVCLDKFGIRWMFNVPKQI
jgi:predicted GIY-YIG superfamily endonuclease